MQLVAGRRVVAAVLSQATFVGAASAPWPAQMGCRRLPGPHPMRSEQPCLQLEPFSRENTPLCAVVAGGDLRKT